MTAALFLLALVASGLAWGLGRHHTDRLIRRTVRRGVPIVSIVAGIGFLVSSVLVVPAGAIGLLSLGAETWRVEPGLHLLAPLTTTRIVSAGQQTLAIAVTSPSREGVPIVFSLHVRIQPEGDAIGVDPRARLQEALLDALPSLSTLYTARDVATTARPGLARLLTAAIAPDLQRDDLTLVHLTIADVQPPPATAETWRLAARHAEREP